MAWDAIRLGPTNTMTAMASTKAKPDVRNPRSDDREDPKPIKARFGKEGRIRKTTKSQRKLSRPSMELNSIRAATFENLQPTIYRASEVFSGFRSPYLLLGYAQGETGTRVIGEFGLAAYMVQGLPSGHSPACRYRELAKQCTRSLLPVVDVTGGTLPSMTCTLERQPTDANLSSSTLIVLGLPM